MENGGKTTKINTVNEISKLKNEIISLRVPNRVREEKENAIPYLRSIKNRKGKKKRQKITVLEVPNVEDSVQDDNLKFDSIPIVKRLSLEELKKVKRMKETIKKRKGRNTGNDLKS